MTETDKMEELFERLPWLREQFEIEQEIIDLLVMSEQEYLEVLRKTKWTEHLKYCAKP